MTQQVKEDDYRLGKNDGGSVHPVKPVIAGEIDIPFPASDNYTKIKELKAQQHDYDIDNLKHKFAIRLVYICLSAVAVLTVIDVFLHPNSAVFQPPTNCPSSLAPPLWAFFLGCARCDFWGVSCNALARAFLFSIMGHSGYI